MFTSYKPNVKATIAFLKLLNVKANDATVNETLQNHPDWPGLLCISDSLNKWNIPNGAGRTELNRIDQLPVPFMAYTNDMEHPLSIVTDVGDITMEFYCAATYLSSFLAVRQLQSENKAIVRAIKVIALFFLVNSIRSSF